MKNNTTSLNYIKSIVKVWLFVFLVLVLIGIQNAYAADSASGTVTDTIDYTFDGTTGTLVISGTGELPDCISGSSVASSKIPWFSYRSDVKSITIESGITYIGAAMFYGCGAESVVMADSVTAIGDYAFEYCESLTSVTFSKNIKEIPYYCFYSCGSLASLTIPSGVEKIDTYAFAFCDSLTSVVIPTSVTEIGAGAFNYTPYFTDYTGEFMVVGDGILIKYNGTSATVNIPSGTKVIAYQAFYGKTSITKVVLPTSVTTIEAEAFSGCSSLANINLNSNVKYIGYDALLGTSYLNQITDDVVIVGDGILYDYQGDDAVVTIPDGVKVIGPVSFHQNFNLTEVVIPDSVTTIGQQAFMGCINLEMVNIPESVTEIEDRAFGYYWDNITAGSSTKRSSSYFYLMGPENEVAEQYASDNGFTYLKESLLSGSCGDNAEYSFEISTGTLTINGTGVTSDYASSNAPWYSFRGLIKHVVVEEGITSLGAYSFYYLTKLETVQLPSTLQSFGNYTFYNTYLLNEVTLPASFSQWNGYAFMNCYKLENVYVNSNNSSFTSVNGVLYNKNKTTLYFYPEGKTDSVFTIESTVTALNGRSMRYSKFETLVVPASVTNIYSSAIYYCDNLKYIEFAGNAPSISSYSIYSDKTNLYNVGYHSGKTGWDTCKTTLSSHTNITWVDLDSISSGLSLNSTSLSLGVGESSVLSINGGFMAGYFEWSSSDASVAGVSYKGEVYANKSGTATITAKSIDGLYTLTCKVTVTGTSSDEDYYFTELPEGEINYTSFDNLFLVIPNEKLYGIYFLNEYNLYFHSFISDTYYQMYDFGVCTDAYYEGEYLYVLKNEDYNVSVTVYNLDTQQVEKILTIDEYSATAIGVDTDGRIYLVCGHNDINNPICVFSSDGELLAEGDNYNRIYRFAGFDSTNGNFYVEAYYNWRYWGYDHDTNAAKAGRYADEKLTMYNTVISSGTANSLQDALLGTDSLVLFQKYYTDHQNSLQLIGDRYLIGASILYGKVYCMDSNEYVPGENTSGYAYTISRAGEDGSDSYSETSSVGVNAVYNAQHDSILMYRNNSLVEELDPDTGEVIATYTTKYNVFNMSMIGQKLVLVEKNESTYYIEVVEWAEPTKIVISGNSTVKVAETALLTAETDSLISDKITWSTSNPYIASVTSEGKVVGWKPGTVTITATSETYGISASYTVKVTTNSSLASADTTSTLGGTVSDNISDNNQTAYWGKVVNSYIYENTDGTFTRVEYISGTGIVVETYTSSHTLKSSKTIAMELSIFGGFYHAADGSNYIVEGQMNSSESDSVEVVRIIKYSSAWSRVSSCSVYGANTYIPFDAGSCRMTENDGMLYIYTCHEMYMSSDGYHHQANMTFVMDMSAMTITDSYYDVMNTSYGYVSHSFNQFIQTDGEYIYRVDHGDANPRGIYISVLPAGNDVTEISSYVVPMSFQGGYGQNATGVSLGGFELSGNNCLIVGNSVDHSDSNDYDLYGQKNIFLLVQSKDLDENNTIWLTDYADTDGVTPYTPHLVKLSDEHFLVMWEEYNNADGKIYTRLVTVDGDGNLTSPVTETNLRLSDCKPVLTSDGLVVWYVTDGSMVTQYSIEPYNLSKYLSGTKISALTNGTTGVTVEWTALDGATGYKLYRKSGSGSYSLLATITSGTTVSYVDKSVTSGTQYTYAIVTCIDDNGNEMETGISNGVTCRYLGAPVITTSNTASGISIKWDVVDGAATYQLYRRTYSNGAWSSWSTINVTTGTSYTDTDVKSGSYYRYMLKAINGSDESAYTATPSCRYLSVPTVTSKNTTSGIVISWNKVTGAANYQVCRREYVDGQWSAWKTIVYTSSITYTDTTVESGMKYQYIVRAKNSWALGVFASTTCRHLSNPVVTTSNVAAGISVKWDAVDGAVKYQVYRRTYSNGVWSSWSTVKVTTGTSYTDTDVKSGSYYRYMLKAINGNDESAYTATSSCRFLAKTSVSAVNTGTGIKLSWTKITGAANYQICRRELVDGVWSAWKTITYATGTSYTDTSVQDGVTYSYIIRAKNSWALGAFTSTPGIKH